MTPTLISRYMAGDPLPAIAADAGMTPAAFRKAMHRQGVYRGTRHYDADVRAQVRQLASDGLGGREIARQLQIGREAVRRWLTETSPNVTDARNGVSPCPNG